MSVEAVISTQVIDTTSVGRSLMTAANAAAVRTAADAQVTLVSGTNIKTVNSTSLLGSGDIAIAASPAGSSGELQYNNASAFGGTVALVYAATTTHIAITSQSAAYVPISIKGAASQSGNLTEWRNSSSTIITSITSSGALVFTGQSITLGTGTTIAAAHATANIGFTLTTSSKSYSLNSSGLYNSSAGTVGGIYLAGGASGLVQLIQNSVVKLEIDNSGAAGETHLRLLDITAGTLKRVSIGAADSGGVGFKVLRVPN